MRLVWAVLFLAADAAVELPRIGCWQDGETIRALYGVPGNLVARAEESCSSNEEFSAADAEGVRTLRLDARWRLAENARGERYLLLERRAGGGLERYELPQ